MLIQKPLSANPISYSLKGFTQVNFPHMQEQCLLLSMLQFCAYVKANLTILWFYKTGHKWIKIRAVQEEPDNFRYAYGHSHFINWLLMNSLVGKFCFDQSMQPISCRTNQCILMTGESRCQDAMAKQGGFSIHLEWVDGGIGSGFFQAARLHKKKMKYIWPAYILKPKGFFGSGLGPKPRQSLSGGLWVRLLLSGVHACTPL